MFSSAIRPVSCLARSSRQAHILAVALQTMENIELSSGAFLTRITACHVTTYYHVGLNLRFFVRQLIPGAGRMRIHVPR